MQGIPGLVYWSDVGVYNVTGGCTSSAIQKLPLLTFTIDGVDYSLAPQDYIIRVSSVIRDLFNAITLSRDLPGTQPC